MDLEKRRLRYQARREIILARAKVYRDSNKEMLSERHKGYYRKHRDKRVAAKKAYMATPEYKAVRAAYETRNRERIQRNNRDYYLKRDYGITLDQYENLLKKQDGVCASCRRRCKSGRGLAVDHDHDTGAVRALLCAGCNTALGSLDDSPALIERLLKYSRQHSQLRLAKKETREKFMSTG